MTPHDHGATAPRCPTADRLAELARLGEIERQARALYRLLSENMQGEAPAICFDTSSDEMAERLALALDWLGLALGEAIPDVPPESVN